MADIFIRTCVGGFASLLALSGYAVADPHDVFGRFSSPNGNSHIVIDDCGDSTPCGVVSWMDPATLPDGQSPESYTNDKGERVLGMTILQGFDRRKRDWRGGSLYSPGNGKRYAGRIKRLENGDLQLKGCIGPICSTQIWTSLSPANEDTANIN